VRRRDSRMTIEGADPDAAQGTAVKVCGNDRSPETLVANGWKVRFSDRQPLLDAGIFGTFQQLLANFS
jgi:hypothetical protein